MAENKINTKTAIPYWLAFVFLVIGAFSWAGSSVAGRMASGNVPPFSLSFIRWFLEDLPKSLLDWGDPFFVLADYRAYVEAQEKVNSAYLDQDRWASMAIRNVAGSGKFSSDRTIGEYASDIWKLDPLKVPDQVS